MNLINKFQFLYKNEIIRRYVVINSFDGILTTLGIILAGFFVEIADPKLVILPAVGAAIAMLVSGVWGAYSAEISEVVRKRGELEKHLLVKIGKAKTSKQRERMAGIVGVVNGLSSFIVSILILIPFFLVPFNIISMALAYYLAFGFIGVMLFLLGVFNGVTAKESLIKNGVKMLLAGLVIGVIFFILAKFGFI